MTVGEKLQEIMDWKGLSQKDLAVACGISRTMISQYIRGFSEPTLEALRKLSDALDVTPWMLINGEPMAVKDIDLTIAERYLIGEYRMLSGKTRDYIDLTIKTLRSLEHGNK